MTEIRALITRFVDSDQPGWVECEFVDAFGRKWIFREKVPVVTNEYLCEDSSYPCPGFIAGQIVGEKTDATGRRVLTVDTEQPWGVEAITGEHRFDVLPEQVVAE